jgi:predicted DNA-binding transcriptional regulator YafY
VNRFDRISAILILLQTKKWITAGEIAQRYGVSVRTVYRDIRTLEEAGIPLGAEAGRGYFIVDGFHLPPVMFTPDEAGSLLMAGKLMEKMADQSIGRGFRSALDKIRAVLPDPEKGFLEKLDRGIEVFYNPPFQGSNHPSNVLSHIQRALADRRVLRIDYQALSQSRSNTNREVEPIVLCFYSMHWHLIAYCRLRDEYRDFRGERITSMSRPDAHGPTRDIQTASQYFSTLEAKADLCEVVIRVDRQTAGYLSTSKYYYGFISEVEYNGYTEMYLVSSDIGYTARWLLAFAPGVEIVSPPELQKIFINQIEILKNRYLPKSC